jgi:hypothetical protein
MISLIRSHTTKSLLRCGVIVASLLLATNAFAADIPIPHPAAAAHVTHSVVARNQRPAFVQPAGIGQLFQGLFGLPLPVTVTAGAASDTGGYDPTFDSTTYDSSAVDVDNSQSQAAIDASDQAMQQEDQSLQDLDASIAATEQQNDAANAAAVQTDINAGM